MSKPKNHQKAKRELWALSTPANTIIDRNIVALTVTIDKNIDADGNGEIQIFPSGRFYAKDNRRPEGWKLTQEFADKLISAADAQKDDYMVDFEHQTIYAASNGQPNPAAGWFKQLEYRNDEGLFAKVKWTKEAASLIQDDKYRYISPFFESDDDGNVLSLFNVGLTNTPAIDGMAKVVALSEIIETKRSRSNFLSELESLVANSAGLSADQLVGAVKEMVNQVNWLTAEVPKTDPAPVDSKSDPKADPKPDPKVEETPDPSKFVPIEAFNEVKEELKKIQDVHKEEALNFIIGEAMEEGKITPAQKKWAMNLGKKDLDSLKQYVSSAPVITRVGEKQSTPGVGNPAALSQDVKDKSFQMNITPERYAELRAKVKQ